MTTIYFVRHAHSHYMIDEYNRPLSIEGRAQAEKFVATFQDIHIDAAYASNYRRTGETLETVIKQKKLKMHTLEALNERYISSAAITDFEIAMYTLWHNPTLSFLGGESNEIAKLRIRNAIDQLIVKHGPHTLLIGTHGNIFTLWLQSYDKIYGYEFWKSLKMPEVIRVVVKNSKLLEVERNCFT